MFRIRNNTGAANNRTATWWYTAYSAWGELASVSNNGVLLYSYTTSGSAALTISITPGQVSSVIFVSTSSILSGPSSIVRTCQSLITNNGMVLSAGLEFLDDLDTATGGWGQ